VALMKCPECFGNCSDKATACPHCGFPIQSDKTNEKETLLNHMVNLCDTLVDARDKGQSKALHIAGLIDSKMEGQAREIVMAVINFVFDPPYLGKETSRTVVREGIKKLLDNV